MEKVQSKRVRQLNLTRRAPRPAAWDRMAVVYACSASFFNQDDDDGEARIRASVSPVSSPADLFGTGVTPGRPFF